MGATLLRVQVEEGILEGTVVPNKFGLPFISFKGIPYAEPPVGKLRFKAPLPKKPWTKIRAAKEHAPECFQHNTINLGSEDCLYLNVYTPNLTPKNLLPVMVYIHEGGFVIGSGNERTHGPYLLSGSLTSWWSNTWMARDRAKELAKQLGCTSNDDKEIYEFLINEPVENLFNHKVSVTYAHYAKESLIVYFGVVSENKFNTNERFFYGHPYEVLRKGIHEGVQVMNGFTADEGVLYFTSDVKADKVFEQADRFLDFFVPEPYTIYCPLRTQIEIGRRFKDFYMKNKPVSMETLDELLEASGLDDLFNQRPMVSHADDLAYLFLSNYNNNLTTDSKSFKMVEQVTALWTNFAKYGDPTPDDSLGVKWIPYNVITQNYLNIGEKLVPETFPEKKNIDFWEQNFKEFLSEYVP
ncbi:antennal esterase CXE10 [Danaus plexippus plexippus]|uniref:Antennal esterase CXE10 n=1 Tax=Danaus plexippus plexippus TaxID=278856 RepID=A0A212EXG5_DANPL|nr:antennal esterase CXE10 [Danaus plexippus plexippus]